jgi:type IV secretion system protein TrbG
MQRLTIVLFVLLALVMWPAASRSGPVVGPDGVVRYGYGDRTPPTLRCMPLFVCDLVLEPGESIVNVAVGDSVRWLIAPASSGPSNGATPHILIKPTEDGLRTNLIVTTNRRAYYLTLVSRKSDPMLRMGFTYPQDLQQAFGAASRSQSERSAQVVAQLPDVAVDKLDFNYHVTGDHNLQPLRVFNDGAHTYLQMPANVSDIPVVFSVGDDGGDALVNYRFTGHYYVVDGVPTRIALVDGNGKGQRRAVILHGS